MIVLVQSDLLLVFTFNIVLPTRERDATGVRCSWCPSISRRFNLNDLFHAPLVPLNDSRGDASFRVLPRRIVAYLRYEVVHHIERETLTRLYNRYVGLAARNKLRVEAFAESSEEAREDFEARCAYESHYHGFYRTGLAGMPWKFAADKVAAEDCQQQRVIQVAEPDADNRLGEAIEDIKINKTDELFCCGAWGGIAFNRWLKVDRVFKSILTQGYYCLEVLGPDVEYNDENTPEPVVFTLEEQRKLREVAVCSKIAGLGSNRAQAATLSAPEAPETCDDYEASITEGSLRAARWQAFKEGNILGARRLLFAPRDVEYGGGGKQSATSSHQQRDSAASGLIRANGAFRGRVQYRKTSWKRFCDEYSNLPTAEEQDDLLDKLCRDSKDVAGQWSKPPPRRKLEEERPNDGFLRFLTPQDSRASVVAYTHNAAVLSKCDVETRRILMKNHIFFADRIKDASVAVERYNRYPQCESQVFKCGAARNTEIKYL